MSTLSISLQEWVVKTTTTANLMVINIRCAYLSCNIAILPRIPRGMYRKSYISSDIDTPFVLPACNSVWPICN